MTLVRCYADDEYGAFWEKWMRSLGDNWETVLTAQWQAMFPKLCAQRTAVMGCPYAVCNQTGRCIYPAPDGGSCSLILQRCAP